MQQILNSISIPLGCSSEAEEKADGDRYCGKMLDEPYEDCLDVDGSDEQHDRCIQDVCAVLDYERLEKEDDEDFVESELEEFAMGELCDHMVVYHKRCGMKRYYCNDEMMWYA